MPGDFEYVLIAVGTAATTVATPGGWSLLFTSGAGTNSRYYVFCVTGGRGASAPGLVFTASTASSHEWHCIAVGGSNNIIDASAASALTSGTTPDPPSVTGNRLYDESIIVGFNFAGATWVPPAGYTIRSLNTGGFDCVTASKAMTTAVAENPAVFTGPGSSNDIYAVTIMLQNANILGNKVSRPFPYKPGSPARR